MQLGARSYARSLASDAFIERPLAGYEDDDDKKNIITADSLTRSLILAQQYRHTKSMEKNILRIYILAP